MTSPLEGRYRIDVPELLHHLRAAGGSLRVESPSEVLRAQLRLAMEWSEIRPQLVGSGLVTVTSDPSTDSLTVALLAKPSGCAPIPIPEDWNARHPVIKALTKKSGRLEVSDDLRPRALRLVQALIDEADRRGYETAIGATATLRVKVGSSDLPLALLEETVPGEVVPEHIVRLRGRAPYRQPATRRREPSGRLRLTLLTGRTAEYWADRKRWTLDQKLGDCFAVMEMQARVAADRLSELEREKVRLASLWESAVESAQQRCIAAQLAKLVDAQAEEADRARKIRRYARRLEHASSVHPASAATLGALAAAARERAETLDPLSDPDAVQLPTLADLPIDEVQKWMPYRMKAERPPTPEEWKVSQVSVPYRAQGRGAYRV